MSTDTTETPGILPDISDPVSAPYWQAARDHRLSLQRCDECGELRWTPSDTCPACLSQKTSWVDLGGTGTIYSYCVYHRALNTSFPDVPYTVVLVRLTEGPIVLGQLVGATDTLAVEAPVTCVFTDVSDAVSLVNFTLTSQ